MTEQQLANLEAELHSATAIVNQCRAEESSVEPDSNKLTRARLKVASCRIKLRDAYLTVPHIVDGVMPDHEVDTEDIEKLCEEYL